MGYIEFRWLGIAVLAVGAGVVWLSVGGPGTLATVILGAVAILTVLYIRWRGSGFSSPYVRRGLDVAWGLLMAATVLWLILMR